MTYDVEDFEKDVIDRSHSTPVLVDFWAEWCGPCKVLGPVLERLANQNQGEWVLAKLDTEKHPSIASRYAIRSIPNVKLFVDGEVTDEFMGALPESSVIEWIASSIPSKHRMQIDGAKQLVLGGDASRAREILEIVIASEPHNEQAVLLLGQTFLGSDPTRAIETVENINVGSKQFESAESIRYLAGMFRHLEDSGALPDESIRDDYITAIDHVRSNKFQDALDTFIGVIRRNRYYDDDGSRKACIAIFNLLGQDHHLTRSYRSNLSNALY